MASSTVVTSAVILPETATGSISSSINPSLDQNGKRESEIEDGEFGADSKRQKINSGDTNGIATTSDGAPAGKDVNGTNGIQSRVEHTRGGPPTAEAPIGKRPSEQEERKRNQRLFGSLLGTLSQKSATGTLQKRKAIEQRAQAKIQALDNVMKDGPQGDLQQGGENVAVQDKSGNETIKSRHANMLEKAEMLRTRSQPQLYYKPWELRDFEKEEIARQIRAVQEEINLDAQRRKQSYSSSRDAEISKSDQARVQAREEKNSHSGNVVDSGKDVQVSESISQDRQKGDGEGPVNQNLNLDRKATDVHDEARNNGNDTGTKGPGGSAKPEKDVGSDEQIEKPKEEVPNPISTSKELSRPPIAAQELESQNQELIEAEEDIVEF